MKNLTVKEIVTAANGQLIMGQEDDLVKGIRHDSRECGQGDMFVAIKGKNQDGHKYIPQVYDKGCRTFFVSHTDGWMDELSEEAKTDVNVILVDDTVYQMGELASYYLDQLDIKKIAVTGSVGKTSTRDMIYYVLNEKYNCGRNLKNFNNDIGLPISIFQFDEKTNAAVLEMGMDHFGEIDRLSSIVRPQIGVITTIGIAHIEKLGSRDGIFQAKMEIAEHIAPKEKGGALVYARDDEFLNGTRTEGDYLQVSVGTDGRSDYIISDIDDFGLDGIEFTLEHNLETHRVKLPVPGIHNASNAAIAIAVGNLAGLSIETAIQGLSKVDLTGRRLRKVNGKTVTVIDDSYNANPDSMKNALKVLEQSRSKGKKTAILGDMFELGDNTEKLHFGVGIFARSCNIDQVITVGDLGKNISDGAMGGDLLVKHYSSKEELISHLREDVHSGDMVLVKASRGMKMEDIVEKAAEI